MLPSVGFPFCLPFMLIILFALLGVLARLHFDSVGTMKKHNVKVRVEEVKDE